MTYTVVLLYPESVTEDFGADIYVSAAHEIDSIAQAVELVQKEAADNLCDNAGTPICNPSDFRCILVLEGEPKCVGDAQGFDDGSDRDEAPHDTADRDFREGYSR